MRQNNNNNNNGLMMRQSIGGPDIINIPFPESLSTINEETMNEETEPSMDYEPDYHEMELSAQPILLFDNPLLPRLTPPIDTNCVMDHVIMVNSNNHLIIGENNFWDQFDLNGADNNNDNHDDNDNDNDNNKINNNGNEDAGPGGNVTDGDSSCSSIVQWSNNRIHCKRD